MAWVSPRAGVFLASCFLVISGCGGAGTPVTPSSSPAAPFPAGDPSGREPYLVRDINPGPASSLAASVLGAVQRPRFVVFGERLFFAADDGVHGVELWQTDGTAAGTRLVSDICPGSCGSSPAWMTQLGDRMLFQAGDSLKGLELWATDGTAGGTYMVADIRPGPESSAPFMFAPVDGRLLVQASGPDFSLQLWSTDGTAGGTKLVREIASLSLRPPAGPQGMLNGLTVFGTDDGVAGQELWASDGTALGTRLVREICPGPCDGVYRGTGNTGAVFDGRLFFGALTGPNAVTQLWASDGSLPGTEAIGASFFPLVEPVVFGEALFFSSGASDGTRALWRTDGTRRGTYPLAPIAPGDFLPWHGLLYVSAGHDVWVTDGERIGQIPVFASSGFVGHGAEVFLDGFSETSGNELWRTDGAVEGTHRVSDIRPGPEGSLSAPFDGVSWRDRIFFRADDGRSGLELWAYRPR